MNTSSHGYGRVATAAPHTGPRWSLQTTAVKHRCHSNLVSTQGYVTKIATMCFLCLSRRRQPPSSAFEPPVPPYQVSTPLVASIPAPPPEQVPTLCQLCWRLKEQEWSTQRRTHHTNYYIPHHATVADLNLSASMGCRLCAFLRQSVDITDPERFSDDGEILFLSSEHLY
jgi:hypothetical protein